MIRRLSHRLSRAYHGTRNLRAVQMLLGHASIATTERYTAVDDAEILAAIGRSRRLGHPPGINRVAGGRCRLSLSIAPQPV